MKNQLVPRGRRYVVPCVVAALVLGGCAASDGGGGTPMDRDGTSDAGGGTPAPDAGPGYTPPESCPGGGETTLSGTVHFPNGTLPVVGALVYVPHGAVDAVPRTGECGECVDSGALAAWTTTAVDGSFTLRGVSEGTHTVMVDKGMFRRTLTVDVTACADNPLAAEQTRLPASAAEGTVPNIGVVTGDYDRMEDVLSRLGLSADAFQLHRSDSGVSFDGDDDAAALLRDRARLTAYDILFVDCGAMVAEPSYSSVLGEPAVRDNLQAFVDGGGRLYVTDQAYDLIENTFPRVVDFVEGSGDGLSTSPEPGDEAQVGETMDTVLATVHVEELRQWLEHTGAIGADGRMPVRGLDEGWAVVDRVDDSLAQVWTSGDVRWLPWSGDLTSESGVKPLTVTFEAGCGRALFTSYHTVSEDASGSLTAQEQALAYLILEIGVCIEDPSLI